MRRRSQPIEEHHVEITISLPEWRMMQAARIALRAYPEAALAIEAALAPALALVDEAIRTMDTPAGFDRRFYQKLEERIDRLADRRLVDGLKAGGAK